MSRNKFIGLIIMMVVSIVGILWVQIRWIKNAVSIQNETFDYYVSASIHDAAGAIESSRKTNFFNDYLLTSQGTGDTAGQVSSFVSMGTYSLGNGGNVSIRITNQSVTQLPGQEPKITFNDTTITTGPGLSSEVPVPADNKNDVVILNNDNPANGGKKVIVRQNDFIEWVKKRQNEFTNLSDKMISDIYQWEKTMEIDKREVEMALRQSLKYRNIDTPFEFAIIRDGVVTDGTYKKSRKEDFLKSKYAVMLFPDNIIRKNLVVSVIFPERANFVLGSMAFILAGSMLLSLIILSTFALSLYFIVRQKKISEMKSDFINNMTHEFKTPIATISLAADTITNPKVINDESSVRHFVSMIKKENNRMNKKVETILQIASLDKKEIEFRYENLSMHSLIERAVDAIEIQVQQRNGKVKLDLNATEPVVYGDGEHLFNLVNNLLDNAIKYSEGSPEILVETVNSDQGLIMSVEDKGIGMSKSVQSRIFERFYRQTSGNVHDVKGFGLGLNYARAIVEAHKGTITVHSEPGKGSRFDVYIPFNWENEK